MYSLYLLPSPGTLHHNNTPLSVNNFGNLNSHRSQAVSDHWAAGRDGRDGGQVLHRPQWRHQDAQAGARHLEGPRGEDQGGGEDRGQGRLQDDRLRQRLRQRARHRRGSPGEDIDQSEDENGFIDQWQDCILYLLRSSSRRELSSGRNCLSR